MRKNSPVPNTRSSRGKTHPKGPPSIRPQRGAKHKVASSGLPHMGPIKDSQPLAVATRHKSAPHFDNRIHSVDPHTRQAGLEEGYAAQSAHDRSAIASLAKSAPKYNAHPGYDIGGKRKT